MKLARHRGYKRASPRWRASSPSSCTRCGVAVPTSALPPRRPRNRRGRRLRWWRHDDGTLRPTGQHGIRLRAELRLVGLMRVESAISCLLSSGPTTAGTRGSECATPPSRRRHVPLRPSQPLRDQSTHECMDHQAQTIAGKRGGTPSVVVERAMEEVRYYGTKEEPEWPDYEGKIKACGTIGPDPPRFSCLHIWLSTARTVPPACGTARRHQR